MISPRGRSFSKYDYDFIKYWHEIEQYLIQYIIQQLITKLDQFKIGKTAFDALQGR